MNVDDTGNFVYESNHPPFFISGFPSQNITSQKVASLLPNKVTRDFITPIGLSAYEGVLILAKEKARQSLAFLVTDIFQYLDTRNVRLSTKSDISHQMVYNFIYSLCKDLRLVESVVTKKTNQFLCSINVFKSMTAHERRNISTYIFTKCKSLDIIHDM